MEHTIQRLVLLHLCMLIIIGFGNLLICLLILSIIMLQSGGVYHLCEKNLQIIDDGSVIFTFFITITPVNDPPVLKIPENYVFQPVQNTRTLIKDVFTSTDNDSSPSDIVYRVLGLGAGMYFENSRSPGRPVFAFTQADLDDENINFVHDGGPNNARLVIQVLNLDQSTSITQTSSVLRISAIPIAMTGTMFILTI